MSSHGEREPDIHAAAVPLYRCIQKSLGFRERHDRVEPCIDLFSTHSKNRSIKIDIFSPG
jgi:hypothetical protein